MISQQIIFCWKQISDTRCVRKEIVEIDILVRSMNHDRKILQAIRIMSGPPKLKIQVLDSVAKMLV